MPHRFTPQKTKQWIPLFPQAAQSLPASAGVFAWCNADVAGQRFPIAEPQRIPEL
jgi:hypothetical protein